MHLLTRIGQNSKQIVVEFANQNTEDRGQKTENSGLILDLVCRFLGFARHVAFGHVVVKTFGKNFYKCLSDKSINAKVKKSKNEQKCAEIDRNARVLNRNEQKMRTF